MKLRSQLFGILALLSLAWLCYGFSATSSAFSNVMSTPIATSDGLDVDTAKAATALGAGIGSGLGITFFACTSLPFTLLFGLLAWRNSVGLKTQKRHEEMLEATRNQGKSTADILSNNQR